MKFAILRPAAVQAKHQDAIVGLGLIANLMTPGADPITPLIVFIPLYIFWEATALILKLSGR